MSIDRSLKVTGGNLASHRNVLKRAERLAKLQNVKGFDPEKASVMGLPKTESRKGGR